jgi:hypothetical protein
MHCSGKRNTNQKRRTDHVPGREIEVRDLWGSRGQLRRTDGRARIILTYPEFIFFNFFKKN